MRTYQCPECGFRYDDAAGNRHEGLKPGTPWLSLPEDYACPSCAVRLRDAFEVLDGMPPPSGPLAPTRWTSRSIRSSSAAETC